ncbi:tRNA-splicing endonuclease subunit Sen54 isoform X3 [Anarhichas minor]|uniref:tRNA-splicing endonuclease subunit Sen54 isoform X3 n=1 Tax=Anarhichas minor TaxID=65739 RepID=UPI003F73B0B4
MADQNKKEPELKFYNEILTPSELFAARSRSHKIPVRGQKDFFPDDSDEQRRRLEQSLTEHWSLISEERVEKLGNLVKATWIPSEQIVELQSPAGKFWQTMGFSATAKQFLLPEEALYLMECGDLQVLHQDLPLSIQDGYEKFLSSSTVSLLQYQVFGHLKRLGYVVHRFDPSSQPSSYARQLNLPQSRDRAEKRVKRKRSDSPSTTSSHTEAQEESDRMEDKRGGHEGEDDEKLPESHPVTSPETSGTHNAAASSAGAGGGGTWWMADVLGDQSDHQRASGSSSHRDFSSILFPDLGSREHLPSCLASPDPSLLPGSLAVGVCDVSHWRRRINLREVKMSPKEQEREEARWKRRWDVNKDRQVRQCRNWAEYRELLARRGGRREGRPAHLWNREVTPLHDPRQPIPTGQLLDKISVIESTHLLEGASRLKDSDDWRICFNVYQPDSVADFKKSNPGKPYSRMCVCSFGGLVPDLRAIKQLALQSGDVPVVFAVVDHGDISFYTFKDFQLPTDVIP